MKKMAHKLDHFKDSIFGVMAKLAKEHQATNLGQGFPDFDGPEWLKDYAQKMIKEGHGQYAPFMGTLTLRESVSQLYKKFYQLSYDAQTEITITVGATEALYSVLTALVDDGDEVIVLEPFYDSYVASIELSLGKAIPVTMHAPHFQLNPKELRAAITAKTKAIIINNPHNPTGKVWTREELLVIAEIAQEFDLFVISDEVYEFLVFDKFQHIPMASLPGLQERTLTISSAGKTFGLTGWKVGWVCAPEKITHAVRLVHQYVTFSVPTPLQEAVAYGLGQLDSYIPDFQKVYQTKRDFFYQGLKSLGFEFPIPQGTYFMMVPLKSKTKLKDKDFALQLVQEYKIAVVPPSSFYLKSNEGEHYMRLCFAKKQETLEKALECLSKVKS